MTKKIVLLALMATAICSPAAANGLGESRPYQFRTDSQRQVNLTLERTRLELLGLLSSGNGFAGGTGGGTGQTGNITNVNVSGSNNVISITQTNSGAQTQDRDCSGADFSVTGGMFGC